MEICIRHQTTEGENDAEGTLAQHHPKMFPSIPYQLQRQLMMMMEWFADYYRRD